MVVARELGEGTTAMAMMARLGYERARARQSEGESENGREQQLRLPLLPLLAKLARPTPMSRRHAAHMACQQLAMMAR